MSGWWFTTGNIERVIVAPTFRIVDSLRARIEGFGIERDYRVLSEYGALNVELPALPVLVAQPDTGVRFMVAHRGEGGGSSIEE